jgi:hypothetical protein
MYATPVINRMSLDVEPALCCHVTITVGRSPPIEVQTPLCPFPGCGPEVDGGINCNVNASAGGVTVSISGT